MPRFPLNIISALLTAAGLAILILAIGQSHASAGAVVPAQVPQWGPDIQVNPTPTGTPYHPVQRDYSLSINPVDPNTVIAGWNSLQGDPALDAYGWSTDQGLTWSGGRFAGPWNPGKMIPIGTVTAAFDANGTAYYASVAQGSNVAGYFVLTTTNGTAWSTPLPVVIDDFTTAHNDEHLAVDPRPSGQYAGSLYVFSLFTDVNYPDFYRGVRERYSRDGGLTWSADVQVSDPNNNYIFYPYGAVASDGTVYVTFEELDNYSISNPPKLYLVRSTDGGQTWGPNQLITGAPVVPIGRPDYKGRELTVVGSANCSLMRINHYPVIAISPGDSNTIYVVWNDGRWQPEEDLCGLQGRHGDIAFSRSTDAGVTWSAPMRINDDPQGNQVDHFQPNIAVKSDGLLGITWLDRRYDPDHFMFDMAYSQSTDGGMTWSANQRVSDASSDPDQIYDYKGVDSPGYRRGLVFGPDYVLPSWVSAVPASATGNFYTDHGTFGAPTPTTTSTGTPTGTPTRMPTDEPTNTVTGTSTATLTAMPTLPAATATSTSGPASSPTPSPAPTSCTIQFADVPPGSTFYSFVRCLACQGLISGYPCGGLGEPCNSTHDPYFRPANSVTRGQAAKIISNSANYQDPIPPGRQTFKDVPPASTFWLYVERVALHGAIHGYSCGGAGEPCPGNYFRPSNNLTRGQLAQIASTAANYQDPIPPGRQTFNDVPPASTFWLVIERVYLHGTINGYACGGVGEPCPGVYYRPNNTVTRGQTAKISANTFFPDCNPVARN
jgi:hypothetical protein